MADRHWHNNRLPDDVMLQRSRHAMLHDWLKCSQYDTRLVVMVCYMPALADIKPGQGLYYQSGTGSYRWVFRVQVQGWVQRLAFTSCISHSRAGLKKGDELTTERAGYTQRAGHTQGGRRAS